MLNSAVDNNFPDFVSVYLEVFDHLTLEFLVFGSIQQVNSDFLKFRIFEIMNFHLRFIMLCLGSIRMGLVISELYIGMKPIKFCYKGRILQRNHRKMTV